jgi:hypothetical protein
MGVEEAREAIREGMTCFKSVYLGIQNPSNASLYFSRARVDSIGLIIIS